MTAGSRARALIGLLTGLVVAACAHDTTPTGAWVMRNGGLTGSIAVASGVQPAADIPSEPTDLGPELQGLHVSAAALVPIRAEPTGGGHDIRPWLADSRPDELIVVFRSSPADRVTTSVPSDIQAAAAIMQTHLADILPATARLAGISPAIHAAKIRFSDSSAREEIAGALRTDAMVSDVIPNLLLALDETRYVHAPISKASASAVPLPDNPLYAWQAWHYGLIGMRLAWGLTTGSQAVLVAVVDDGIRFDHPSIKANLTADGYDFVSDDFTIPRCVGGPIGNAGDGDGYDPDPTVPSSYSPTQPTCFTLDQLGGHGLHVAGTIGAVGNSGVGMTGVNWKVRIRPVRVMGIAGVGTTWDIAQGVLYAAGLPADDGAGGYVQAAIGARVINISLGSNTDDPIMRSAIVAAAGTGALIVAAAGNSGNSVPHYPAAYPEALAVAAVRPDGQPASYSNFGPYVDIRAPGGDVSQGGGSGGVGSTLWNFPNSTPDYAWATGTSMASPHVAGVAALLLARTPSLTAAELRQRLTQWSTGGATQYGAGLLNAYNSLAQRVGPTRKLFVRLQLTSTGQQGDLVEAEDDGTFSFSHAPVGKYFVFGGADENGDGQIGVPGRWWGAVGGVTSPTSLVMLDKVETAVSLTVGPPTVAAPNHSISSQLMLVPGGYVQATIANLNQLDVYRFTVGKRGVQRFETSAWVGACGFANEEATAIGVFDTTGKLLGDTQYIDGTRYNYCSRLDITLAPGVYLVAVAGAFSNGRYRLEMQQP